MTHTTTEQPEAPDVSLLPSPSLSDFRLARIEPEQVEAAWPMIKQSLAGALPVRTPEAESTFMAILASIQARGMIAWVVRTQDQIYTVMTTVRRVDETSGHSFLMIYTLYAMPGLTMPLDVWVDSFKKLSVYARSLGCESVILETRNEEVAHLAKRVCPTADIETRVINMPLADIEED